MISKHNSFVHQVLRNLMITSRADNWCFKCAHPIYKGAIKPCPLRTRILSALTGFSQAIKMFSISFQAVIFGIIFAISSADYLTEVPVKLMQVNPVATRFPAAESTFRTDITSGHVRSKFVYILSPVVAVINKNKM